MVWYEEQNQNWPERVPLTLCGVESRLKAKY